ncbi:uncharacterized protein LOC121780849 [Salvia splendens]|uniref:uncharacterized protein LOC121780849 n=1 Tax=Salvia splendens TaxID=180675 RepID=UPI001C277623|nr:uncharacterized protein LOC121780849 [Salvia splendens]
MLQHSLVCGICACEKPISDSFQIHGCNHSYCTRCVSNYVAARLQESIAAIGCPVLSPRRYDASTLRPDLPPHRRPRSPRLREAAADQIEELQRDWGEVGVEKRWLLTCPY